MLKCFCRLTNRHNLCARSAVRIPSPASFTSHCESVSGEMWTVQQKDEFVLWYAELKSVHTSAESCSHIGVNACE
jgi:hypothetical protein